MTFKTAKNYLAPCIWCLMGIRNYMWISQILMKQTTDVLVDGIMPQRTRLKVLYSALSNAIIEPGTGIRIGLTPDIK